MVPYFCCGPGASAEQRLHHARRQQHTGQGSDSDVDENVDEDFQYDESNRQGHETTTANSASNLMAAGPSAMNDGYGFLLTSRILQYSNIRLDRSGFFDDFIIPEQVCEEQPLNTAFLIIKPHANTKEFRAFVQSRLVDSGIRVIGDGCIDASDVDARKLYDQHCLSVAASATLLKPENLDVPADKFERKFGLSWDDAMARNLVLNASVACARLQVDGDGLAKLWQTAVKDKDVVRFGPNFSCGKISAPGKVTLYVFNGFFMSARSAFTSPGEQIHYFSVAWDPKMKTSLSWYLFRYSVVGETDPQEANPGSIRHDLDLKWEELGLESEPSKHNNGLHASASPFEGLAERCNWLGADIEKDCFGQRLLNAGISREWIEAGFNNPEIKTSMTGEMGHLFKEVENLDSEACIQKVEELHAISRPGVMHEAFVVIKPHARTKAYISHVLESLRTAGISVLAEGDHDDWEGMTATTASGSSQSGGDKRLHYYFVRWDAQRMPWTYFQTNFVGHTDPAFAASSSLRGLLYTDWRSFDLKQPPSSGLNGLHASSSAFETLADRCRLLGDVGSDSFAEVLVDRGIDLGWIKQNLDNDKIHNAVQNMDTDDCAKQLERFWLHSFH